MNKPPTLYLETTVPSYYVARPSRDVVVLGHQETTRQFWERELGKYEVCVSETVLKECAKGDPELAERRLAVIGGFPILKTSDKAETLALGYVRDLVLPPQAEEDALHLAVATLNLMDYLVTWNCRHLANGHVIRRLTELNTRLGLITPVICTPEELTDVESTMG